MTETKALRTKYLPISPNRSGFLEVSGGHKIYWEESGNPDGKPIIFLHGGPGGGTDPGQREFFDPQAYRIILVDQRGCGKSTPHAKLENNTTWDLVADIEVLRKHLGILKWVVFGGSWGSTLALAYSIKHPEQVKALVLRGIFLCRREELEWFYQGGAHHLFPDPWDKYLEPIPAAERGDLMAAYYKRLTSADESVRLHCAKVWSIWEASTSKLRYDPNLVAKYEDDHTALAFARIECHYFVNGAFFETDNWLLENAGRLKNIPIRIAHGRYDVVCPVKNAWELKKVAPHAQLEIIPDAGHAASEIGITDALIRFTDEFRTL
jgi:proline iminopeptidase